MSDRAVWTPETQPAPNGPSQPAGAASLLDDEQRVLAEAERALAERPSISITLRIVVSMLLCFLLVLGVVIASMVLVSHVGSLQEFLDRAGTYAFEVEHARRHEKNYFLYGTGLDDAIAQVQSAHNQLRGMRTNLVGLTDSQAIERMEDNLEAYGRLLERLVALSRTRSAGAAENERQQIEREIRRRGAQLIADATDLVDRERFHLRTAIRTSGIASFASLLFILFVMVVVAYVLTRQVANPLRRFVGYTERIANGDFSPIMPARRYRDEFSRLAVAINRMMFRLKEREAQLVRTSRMAAVGTLTAGIAHEINNPLNNIGLNAEALHDGLDTYSDEQKRKMLEDILVQVERASVIVKNLLDFTRVEKPVLVPLSLRDTVEDARRIVANEAEINRVEFRVDVPEGLPRVQGNPRNLQQVFLNLFLNAIQAMPEGGVLAVRGHATDDGWVEVEVTDTGIGIPEENIQSIFDPFFTTKEVGAGTGLGLFVSLGIVKKHNGTITVHSKVGEGTTFAVRLPAADQRTAAAAPREGR